MAECKHEYEYTVEEAEDGLFKCQSRCLLCNTVFTTVSPWPEVIASEWMVDR